MSSNDRFVLVAAVILAAVVGGLAWSLLRDGESTPETDRDVRQDTTTKIETPVEIPKVEPPQNDAGVERTEVIPTEVEQPNDVVTLATTGPKGTVRGIVYAPRKAPIAGAEVELLVGSAILVDVEGLHKKTGRVASTDETGAFVIEDAPVGTEYLVRASHPDWASNTVGPVVIKDGEVTDIASIQLKIATRVYGQVTDLSGLPIAGAQVSATNRSVRFGRNMGEERLPPWKTILTDPSGEFEFENLAFKDFSISVAADGFASQAKVSTSALSRETEREMNFQLGLPFSISGWIKNDEGVALAGAMVQAHLLASGYLSEGFVESNESGEFIVNNLSEGNYVLNVELSGYSKILGDRVEAGARDKIIVMQRQGTIEGRAISAETGDPVRNFLVTVKKHRDGRPPINTDIKVRVADDKGRFVVEGLDPDIYKIYVRAAGYAIAESEPYQVARGSSVTGVSVLCDKGGTITGRVTNAAGRGLSGAFVKLNVNNYSHNALMEVFGNMIQDITRPERSTKTDSDGKYVLDLLSDGEYQVAVAHPQFTDSEVNDVIVEAGRETAAGQIILSAGGSCEGVVWDAKGAPIAGARVSVTTNTGSMKSALADEGGFFQITHLRPGTYKLTIQEWPDKGDEAPHPLVKMALAAKTAQEIEVGDGRVVRIDLRLVDTEAPVDRTPRSGGR